MQLTDACLHIVTANVFGEQVPYRAAVRPAYPAAKCLVYEYVNTIHTHTHTHTHTYTRTHPNMYCKSKSATSCVQSVDKKTVALHCKRETLALHYKRETLALHYKREKLS
jgi:hypothetical protein